MGASGSRRRLAWFVFLVSFAMLPFAPLNGLTSPAYADSGTFDGKEIRDLCTITANGQSCPVFPPPPGLINVGAKAAAGPEIAAALDRLEDQAIASTLADHQLPDSDRDAVLSWAREDAQLALWGLISEAISTPAGDRTTDQQLAVDWMTMLDSAQPQDAAVQAGAEYAKWAGLDLHRYLQLARDPATIADQLTTFLAQDVRTYDPNFQAGFGYCQYVPPSPYSSDDYDGSDSPNCGNFCTSILGCPIPTPTYKDFVNWGKAVSLAGATNEAVSAQAVNIGLAAGFGAVVVGTGLAAIFSSAIVAVVGATIWAFSMGTVAVTSAAAAAAIAAGSGTAAGAAAAASTTATFVPSIVATGAAAAGIIGAVFVIILAIVVAVLEGIRVADNAALPGKIAQLVIGSRDAETDPATVIGTTDGQKTLFYLYVGATLPLPRTDLACDNSRIPPWAYTSSVDPNLLIYVPLGSNTAITSLANREGCLNPPPIPPATPADAHFLVSSEDDPPGQPAQVSSTISVGGAPIRMHGSWFIVGNGSNSQQTLRLQYVDWDGDTDFAWLYHDGSGYHFVGAKVDASTTIDPDACQDDGSCWTSDEIQYVGPDGQGYSASIEEPAAATGQPTYSPANPVEASEVSFDAGDFEPPSSDHSVTYTWRFQHLGCGWVECVLLDQGVPAPPSYSDPVTGKTATHSWESIGPAKVELTATDQHGHTATTVFVVNVGNVAPTALALHDNETTVGTPVTLQGVVSDVGTRDDLNVEVNFGDGVVKSTKVGENSIPLADPDITRLRLGSQSEYSILATHTYTEPGIYYGTYTVSDWGGGTDFDTFTVQVTGQQKIAFPAVDDHTYGDLVDVGATGTPSGSPVTFTTGPADVCEPTGDGFVRAVGVGTCTVTAHQEADPPVFLAAPTKTQSFDVAPADLTITADDQTRVYGAGAPTYTASFVGLVNGDTKADVAGLTITGAPATAGVGSYDITASGASDPNYDISFVKGTEHVTRAPLTITADDQTRVYGDDFPSYSASYDGFVNGDDEGDVAGLQLNGGAPAGADVGDYAIRAEGATSPNYAITLVNGTEHVTPADLTITADDQTQVYGAADPTYTATYDGLVNGDTRSDITGLTFAGPPHGSHVGAYPITPSGASNGNYDITFAAGTQHVTPAPLTITADDRTKVYGAPNPTYTATYDGLVDGDTTSAVDGLKLAGPPSGSGVGAYAITPSGASSPDYDITFAPGIQTVTPAPLTIRPADAATAFGQPPTLTWTGDGWVNGDSDVTFAQAGRTPPTCTASALVPGEHAGAITCSGAHDPNYAIGYATASLRVDPLLSLDATGLPAGVPRRAILDGVTVTVPVTDRVLRYGSTHAYRFPVVLLAHRKTYVTTVEAFDGPVTANVDVTATYRTMHRVLRQAKRSGAVTKAEAARLDQRWDKVEDLIAPRKQARLLEALHAFAHLVRQESGAGIDADTARDLLAYTRLVYQRYGGTGSV
jgi:hypothetical protein